MGQTLLPFFKTRKLEPESLNTVGLEIKKGGVAVSCLNSKVDPVLIEHCQFYPCTDENRGQKLKDIVQQHDWQGVSCNLLLSVDKYEVKQIESPRVSDEELSNAIRWKIQETSDFSMETRVLDYYPLPKRSKAEQQHLSVVLSQRGYIDELSQLVNESGLKLKFISIPELALKNFATQLPENEQGVAFLHLMEQKGLLILIKSGLVYVARLFNFGYTNFIGDRQQDSALAIDNKLTLEVQRTLDYYESHFAMPAINSVVITALPEGAHSIINGFNYHYGTMARIFDVTTLLNSEVGLSDDLQAQCMFSLAATTL